MARDPRDSGEPHVKAWEEFRASYAAAFLFVWLAAEMRDSLNEYGQELHGRFMSGWDIQEGARVDSDLPYDQRGFPLPPVGGVLRDGYVTNLSWMSNSEAHELYEQLFPHRDSARDISTTASRLTVVALNAGLETYMRAVGISARGPLPRVLESYFHDRNAAHLLDSATMRALADCDATRNIVVHNRGIVDERYMRSVPYPAFEQGEFRSLSAADLHEFARAVWRTAVAIRNTQMSSGG